MKSYPAFFAAFALWFVASPAFAQGVGSRVFVVERELGQVAVYDYLKRDLRKKRIKGLGNLHHATMTFTPDLKYGYISSRDGKLTRIDLEKLEVAGQVNTSKNSIDIAVSQDGRFIATAEYIPGGVTVLDARSLKVVGKIDAPPMKGVKEGDSRVTGMVDAPGNLFVCTLMERREVWVIDANDDKFPVIKKIALPESSGLPYDAMITPNGRFYVVGLLGNPEVAVIDLAASKPTPRIVSLLDPNKKYDREAPVKLPHMASWAVAGNRVFVPLVGEKRLVVLDRHTWKFVASVPLRGHPVYAVRTPSEREIWVSFSGEKDDSFIQIIDVESMKVKRTIEAGGKIYHMDFTSRGAYALVSANRAQKLYLIDTASGKIVDSQPLSSPSGVFGVWRAFRIGL